MSISPSLENNTGLDDEMWTRLEEREIDARVKRNAARHASFSIQDAIHNVLKKLNVSAEQLGYEDELDLVMVLGSAFATKFAKLGFDAETGNYTTQDTEITSTMRNVISKMLQVRQTILALLVWLNNPTGISEVVYGTSGAVETIEGVSYQEAADILSLIREELFDLPLLQGRPMITNHTDILKILTKKAERNETRKKE